MLRRSILKFPSQSIEIYLKPALACEIRDGRRGTLQKQLYSDCDGRSDTCDTEHLPDPSCTQPIPCPEPGTLLMLVAGIGLLRVLARQRGASA